jgi:hypothetical protein
MAVHIMTPRVLIVTFVSLSVELMWSRFNKFTVASSIPDDLGSDYLEGWGRHDCGVKVSLVTQLYLSLSPQYFNTQLTPQHLRYYHMHASITSAMSSLKSPCRAGEGHLPVARRL